MCDNELASKIQRAIDELSADIDTQVELINDFDDGEEPDFTKNSTTRVTSQLDDEDDASNGFQNSPLFYNVEAEETQDLVTYTRA